MTIEVGSRAQRWVHAAAKARAAQRRLDAAIDDICYALYDLRDVQCEYGDWYDNMPDYTRDGVIGEKLAEITAVDLADDFNLVWLDDLLDEVELVATDLPGKECV